MPARTDEYEYIDVTTLGDTQKLFLAIKKTLSSQGPLGVHVAFGTSGTNPICIGCGCCSARANDPFYCGQCQRGVPRP